MPENQNFISMKKLFFASIVMLATLTACNNAETSTAPEEQQNQTFAGKEAAKDGDENEEVLMAAETLKKDKESGGGTDTERILCHSSYSDNYGHACVKVNGHLFNVTWAPYSSSPSSNSMTIVDEFNDIVYDSTPVKSCGCR